MSTDSLVVTSPTGVDVELAIAGPGSRSYAFIIDWHIRLLIAVTWFALSAYVMANVPLLKTKSAVVIYIVSTLPAVAIYFLYHPLVEALMRGRTPGKRMAGVRIVNRQGGTPSILAIFIRNGFRLIDSMPIFYGVGLCTTIFSKQRVRLGDLAAGTLLVHDGNSEGKALQQLGSFALNPVLDAETLVLGNDLLLRWRELQPDVRHRLARDLLSRIAVATGAAPTPEAVSSLDDLTLQQKLRDALAGKPA